MNNLAFKNGVRGLIRSVETATSSAPRMATAAAAAASPDERVAPKPTSEIPGFKPRLLIGSLYDLMKWNRANSPNKSIAIDNKELHLFWLKVGQHFGPIIQLTLPGQPAMVAISEPSEIEKVFRATMKNPIREGFHSLKYVRNNAINNYFDKKGGILTENNEEWWRVRSKVQKPMMDKKNVVSFLPAMDSVAVEFVDRIALLQETHGEMPPDFLQDLYKWALESVSLVALNRRLGGLAPDLPSDSMPMKLINSVNGLFKALNDTEISFQLWRLFRTPSLKRLEKYHDDFLKVADAEILATEAALLAKKSDGDGQQLTLMESLLITPGLSRLDVVTLILDMLFAGIDTTSHSTAFLLYLLSRNPECQKKLQEEVDLIFEGKDATTSLDESDLAKMTYLKCCIKESMRIFPLVIGNVRTIEEDMVLNGYLVPKGRQIFMMFCVTTQDERFFKRPTEFLPERWLRSRPHGDIHPYASLPFSHGLRMCIGRRLAEQEMLTVMARIMQRFTVDYKYEDMTMVSKLVATPSQPLQFSFAERR